MKQSRSVACAWIGAAVIILSAVACSRKNDSGADASGQDPTAAVNSALSQVEDKAKAAMKDLDPKLQAEVERLRQATEKLAADAAKAKDSLTSKTQSALDEARQLISANRSNDAQRVLNSLSPANLTPEQRATLDSLKEQLQMLGHQAAEASEKAAAAVTKAVQKN